MIVKKVDGKDPPYPTDEALDLLRRALKDPGIQARISEIAAHNMRALVNYPTAEQRARRSERQREQMKHVHIGAWKNGNSVALCGAKGSREYITGWPDQALSSNGPSGCEKCLAAWKPKEK